MTRPTAALLALAVVFIVVAGGCGGIGEVVSEGSSASTTTSTAPTTTAPDAPSTTASTTMADTVSTTMADSTTTTQASTTVTSAPTTTVPLDARPLPADAAAFAAELVELELALRDPALSEQETPVIGRRQQQLYRLLTVHPDWFATVEATADPAVLPAISLNWFARQQLSAHVSAGQLATTVPAWRINEPRPADELLGYYRAAEAEIGVPWEVLASINLVETRMGRIEGVSTAGAVGPMQFLPSTWDWCCEGDPTDPADAIRGAATYLEISGAPGDLPGAVFAYNRSTRYVDAVLAYAEVLAADELAYRGYHAWDVYFLSASGLLRLAPGYEELEPVDVDTWLADHPEALLAGVNG